DLSKYLKMALILSRDRAGLNRRLRSLSLGNGFTSLILSIKYSTSDSVNSFNACSFLFLLIFFFLIPRIILEYNYLTLMTNWFSKLRQIVIVLVSNYKQRIIY